MGSAAVSRQAARPKDANVRTAAPLRIIDGGSGEPDLPTWPPARLTPELIAAYKRHGDVLRAKAMAAAMRSVVAWLLRKPR